MYPDFLISSLVNQSRLQGNTQLDATRNLVKVPGHRHTDQSSEWRVRENAQPGPTLLSRPASDRP